MCVNFVAEVSSNHNQDLKRSLKFIETAAAIGCSAVKFQLFKIDKLFASEIIEKSKDIKARKKWELPLKFVPILSKKCHELNLKFSCTPFYTEAVKELQQCVDYYKIASYELLHNDLIEECARTGFPLILSTGMATLDEIDSAIESLRSLKVKDVTLLHCVSSYPTPAEQCNLAAIKILRERYKCKVGWSDHTASRAVIYRAVHKWGATMVEFHMDLDGKGVEFSGKHCWLPDDIKEVIENIKMGIKGDGIAKKAPLASEISERNWRADPIDGLRPLRKIRKKWNLI